MDASAKVDLRADASAKVEATAKGTDAGLTVVSLTGLALFVAGLLGLALAPAAAVALKVVAAGGAVGGVGMGLLGAYNLLSKGRQRNAIDSPQTEIIVGDAVVRSAHIERPGDMVRLLRHLVAERPALPAPHGRVIGRDGARLLVEPYSEAEKEAYMTALTAREHAQDARALQAARKVMAAAQVAGKRQNAIEPAEQGQYPTGDKNVGEQK
jgi:hypothetical protein